MSAKHFTTGLHLCHSFEGLGGPQTICAHSTSVTQKNDPPSTVPPGAGVVLAKVPRSSQGTSPPTGSLQKRMEDLRRLSEVSQEKFLAFLASAIEVSIGPFVSTSNMVAV